MTTDTETDLADARRWALRTLNDAELTDPVETTAVLRLITRSGYVLSADAAEAACVVSHPETAHPYAALFGREQRLTEEVTQFSQSFFQLSPDQRRLRWQMLHDAVAEFSGLLRWLDHLERGLDVAEVPSSSDERLKSLIKACCDVFVAKPPDYQRLRQSYEQSFSGDLQIVAEIVSSHPKFIHTIAPWIETISKRQLAKPEELTQLSALHNRKSRTQNVQTAQTESKTDAWPWWGWLLIMFGLRMVFKILKELNP